MRKPKTSRPLRGALGLVALSLLAVAALLPATASAADPDLIWERCVDGHASGDCDIPLGIAADPATGEVYATNLGASRVDVFTPWGDLVRAWGWGVVDGSSELQVCGPGASPPAPCQEGLAGSGVGQLNSPQGIALDSAGDVYVADRGNDRIQKFDSDGHFLLMVGGEVDKGGGAPTNPGNLCTAEYIANGDACGAGSIGTGNGQFGERIYGVGFGSRGSDLAVDPNSDTLFAADDNRIQKFDSGGHYLGQLPLPEPGSVASLAFDRHSGDLYFTYASDAHILGGVFRAEQPDVYRLNAITGSVVGQPLDVRVPRSIATDPSGNVYVFDDQSDNQSGAPDQPPNHLARILEFNSNGNLVETILAARMEGLTKIFELGDVYALATGTGCGIPGVDLYIGSNRNFKFPAFFAAFGPPPNPNLCPPPSLPPSIEETYAVSVDTTGATVRAEINPHFWPDTYYYVQYGTGKCSEGGCTLEKPLAPGSKLDPKVVNTPVKTAGVFLDGLEADTVYHYRFVAKSGGGGPVIGPERELHTYAPTPAPNTNCPNQVFRTGPGARLPDCRGYEMVSPVDKNNGDVALQTFPHFVQASGDGNRMTFSSLRSFGEAEAAPLINQYFASRDPQSGWSTENINPPREAISYYPAAAAGEGIQYKAFSENLCQSWLVQDTGLALVPGAPPFVPNLYRRSLCDPKGYELLTSVIPPGFGHEGVSSEFYPEIQGFSTDGSRSAFRADASLTPNAAPKKLVYQVYLAYGEGKLRLVSVLPNGNTATTNSSVGTPHTFANYFREDNVHNAVSEDGSRIYWSNSEGTGIGSSAEQPGRLYVRLNATEAQSKLSAGKCTEAAKACTLLVSPELKTRFITASPQGERAIYEVGEENPAGGELFEYDLATQSSHSIAKGIEGVVGASEDTTRIYFVSTEVLSGGQENSVGDEAQTGEFNLYRYDSNDSSLIFVATLSSKDDSAPNYGLGQPSPFAVPPMRRMSRVSPDGEQLAFLSHGSLTGYDNTDQRSGEADAEVFLYDAAAGAEGTLVCASCNPSGARPVGRVFTADPQINSELRAASYIPGSQSHTHSTGVLSEDGKRLYFNSFEALLPRDTNGRMDVYQWQAPGSGDCDEADADYFDSNGGCISLISTGESPRDSELFEATPDGEDVFFATQSSLVKQDVSLVDVYDARIGGGFPPPAEPAPSCEGEACQGAPAPPNDPTPGSASFEGAGNVKEESAAKKKQKKHVKKKQSKKHKKKAKKRAKRAGAKGGQGR